MREIRQSGSEGGGAPKGALPTPIVEPQAGADRRFTRRCPASFRPSRS
jgi:hypothetical protein